MIGTVAKFRRYRFKGAQGEDVPEFTVHEQVGIEGDRRFGLRRAPGPNEWAKKDLFYVCMNEPRMAVEQPVYDGASSTTLAPTEEYLEGLAQRLGVTGELVLQDTGGRFNLSDTKPGSHISILNLATLRAFSEFVGEEVDPERFRMNIHVEGLDPFEELTWADTFPGARTIYIGDRKFRVDDACERCPAIMADPKSGVRDTYIFSKLAEFMRARGYRSPHRNVPTVMGILAAPIDAAKSAGSIKLGDKTALIG